MALEEKFGAAEALCSWAVNFLRLLNGLVEFETSLGLVKFASGFRVYGFRFPGLGFGGVQGLEFWGSGVEF